MLGQSFETYHDYTTSYVQGRTSTRFNHLVLLEKFEY